MVTIFGMFVNRVMLLFIFTLNDVAYTHDLLKKKMKFMRQFVSIDLPLRSFFVKTPLLFSPL
jgi:hypothetical protein